MFQAIGFPNFSYLFLIYLVLANLTAFLLMGADKHKARRGKWRIPERTLFLAAILGGSIGSILGMAVFRHKTRHPKFTVGMPVILILQVILLLYLAGLLPF